MRASRVCSYPGCIGLVNGRGSLCKEHERLARQQRDGRAQRPNSTQRGYDAAWRRVRGTFIARHPYCVACGKPTEHVDHIIPISQGGERLKWSNLRPFCQFHHNQHTAKNGGGFGNARG